LELGLKPFGFILTRAHRRFAILQVRFPNALDKVSMSEYKASRSQVPTIALHEREQAPSWPHTAALN